MFAYAATYVEALTMPTEMLLISVGKSSPVKMFSTGKSPMGMQAWGMMAMTKEIQ